MTMSTYKSLGGPAGGMVLTRDAALAARLDAIAYPGLTANFDVAKTAALAISLLDWQQYGPADAQAMVDNAVALAAELERCGLPVHHTGRGPTTSHQLAVDATQWGGGHRAAQLLRRANLLACAIGLPFDEAAGLRLGTPEITRLGMTTEHMAELAELIADGLAADADADADTTAGDVAARTSALRRRFTTIHYVATTEAVMSADTTSTSSMSTSTAPTGTAAAVDSADRSMSAGHPAALSADQLATFHDDGVIVLPERFSGDEVAEITVALDELMAEDVPQNIREVERCRAYGDGLHTCATRCSAGW